MLSEVFNLQYSTNAYIQALAGAGAFGVALQNYPAVVLFLNGLLVGGIPASVLLNWSIQITALATGGLCSGMVNFWMNIELLEEFYDKIKDGNHCAKLGLTGWEKLQYYSGILVFVVTGILFGLMAFTFAMEGPLAILSIVTGLLVACIMTIQEVDAWLSSYDSINSESALTIGKLVGHIIAAGNVLALSLLFTLSLAQGLIALNVAAQPALVAGFAVAFSFGAFTEYYFYNFYLSNFCKDFGKKLTEMMSIPNVEFGFLCVSINAFVNAALTYSGVELLTGLLITAHVTLPPLVFVTALATISAFFAGSASFILGLNFWIRQSKVNTEVKAIHAKSPNILFAQGTLLEKSANDSGSENELNFMRK